jgi:Tfp pilus assembly protein PilF
MELNDLDNARTAFEKALQIQTDPTTPYRHMIKANLAFNEDEGDSLIIFERMNQRDIRPEDLEDYDLATIEAIIDNDPEISKTINDLGLISARRGEINGAIAYFEQSLQIWPSNSAAKKNLQALKQLKK